jgi:hypothetical protein
MSTLYAFINQEYFEAWCVKNDFEKSLETQIQFMNEFGSPILQYTDPESSSYVKLEKGHCIYINFNYYAELRKRFPAVVLTGAIEQETTAESFFRSTVTWASNFLNKTILRRVVKKT